MSEETSVETAGTAETTEAAAVRRTLNRRTFLASTSAVAAATTLATVGSVAVAPAAAAASPAFTVPDVPVRAAARNDPTEATLAEAATLLRSGRLTATDLVQAHLDRITQFDAVYQAFAEVTGDAALTAARQADRTPHSKRGPLAGIPLCIKDNYFTAGVPTRANSFIFADFVPDTDATAVARLKAAGGIVLGKGQMPARHHPGHHAERHDHHGQRVD